MADAGGLRLLPPPLQILLNGPLRRGHYRTGGTAKGVCAAVAWVKQDFEKRLVSYLDLEHPSERSAYRFFREFGFHA
jgi:hypothetical protein